MRHLQPNPFSPQSSFNYPFPKRSQSVETARKPRRKHPVKQLPTIAERDRKFLQQLHRLVLERIDDPELGVRQMCAKTFTSDTQLFRRLKRLTGKNATEYIRSIRLTHARLALQATDQSIADIAYAFGFTDPNYFSRVFRSYFGQPPSLYRNTIN